MKKRLKVDPESIYTSALLLIFAAALLYNFSLILTKINPYFIDSDLVNEITYRQQCYLQKTLFPENFIHSNELFATRPVLVYGVFYKITADFLLAYQLEVILMLVLQLLAVVFLCKCMGLKRNSILFALDVFLIWMPPLIKNVLWLHHDAYSLFAIAVLLTLSARIIWRKGKHKKLSVAGCMGISAVMGLLTIKMSLVLYIPLLFADIVILVIDYRKGKSVKKQNAQLAVISCGQMIVNVVFYKLCLSLFSGKFVTPEMEFANIQTMLSWNNISNRFVEVLGAFGIQTTGGKILSGRNILFMLYGVVFLLIIYVICRLLRTCYDKEDSRFELVVYVLSIIILNFGLLTVMAWGPSYRYYFSAFLLMPVLLGIWLDGFKNNGYMFAAVTGSLLIFGGGVILNYNESFAEKELPLLEVAEYLEEKECPYVAASYWNAAAIKGYLNGGIETAHSRSWEIGTLTPGKWMIDTSIFQRNSEGRDFALVLEKNEYESITYSFMRVLLDKYPLETTKVGNYYIFMFEENPFILMEEIKKEYNAGLPSSGQSYKIVYPDNSDLSYNGAKLDENNVLVSDGKEMAYVMAGPNIDSIEGNYNITLNYAIEHINGTNVEEKAAFDVALDSQSYRGIICEDDASSVTMENVHIDEGHKFEIRVYAPKGIRVYVYSVEYERLN